VAAGQHAGVFKRCRFGLNLWSGQKAWYIVSMKHKRIGLFPGTLKHGRKSGRSKLVLSDEDRAELAQLLGRARFRIERRNAPQSCWGYHAGETVTSMGWRLGMIRLSRSASRVLRLSGMSFLSERYYTFRNMVQKE
jgi:hypothetical protein